MYIIFGSILEAVVRTSRDVVVTDAHDDSQDQPILVESVRAQYILGE